jgi:hypothetical protein
VRCKGVVEYLRLDIYVIVCDYITERFPMHGFITRYRIKRHSFIMTSLRVQVMWLRSGVYCALSLRAMLLRHGYLVYLYCLYDVNHIFLWFFVVTVMDSCLLNIIAFFYYSAVRLIDFKFSSERQFWNKITKLDRTASLALKL